MNNAADDTGALAQPTESDEKSQAHYLHEARDAAMVGDPITMLASLHRSFALDGLVRRLTKDWPRIPFEDVRLLVADAVDILYGKVRDGEKVRSPLSFILKIAHRKACDFYESRKPIDAMDPEELEAAAGRSAVWGCPSSIVQGAQEDLGDRLDYDERRKCALRIARGLLPRLGQKHVQDVMSYIFDAVEANRYDIPNQEIEEALQLSSETVRTAKTRGFRRLARIAKDERLVEQEFDFLGIGDDDIEK
jgi:DNA-directed RNA polymerase specialized sigma24 family protein